MKTVYPSLSIPAPTRLAMFKREAANGKWARPMTWRDVRFATLRSDGGSNQGFNDKTPVWYFHSGPQFRNEKFCDEVDGVRINHKGWFTDGEFCEDTSRGIIGSLPHGKFIAGYFLSMNGERVYFPELFDDETDAANMADEHARIIGEEESEHAAKFQAAQSLENEIEDSFTRLRECIVLRHVKCMDYVKSEIIDLIETIRDKRETLKTEYAGVL